MTEIGLWEFEALLGSRLRVDDGQSEVNRPPRAISFLEHLVQTQRVLSANEPSKRFRLNAI